jgi:acyl-coenzyme A synthetase/AMP-(fatty) acid ligase
MRSCSANAERNSTKPRCCFACREVLEPYEIPRTFTFVENMPRTITGKTDERSLATAAAG